MTLNKFGGKFLVRSMIPTSPLLTLSLRFLLHKILRGIVGAPCASELLPYQGAFLVLVKLSPSNGLFLMVPRCGNLAALPACCRLVEGEGR